MKTSFIDVYCVRPVDVYQISKVQLHLIKTKILKRVVWSQKPNIYKLGSVKHFEALWGYCQCHHFVFFSSADWACSL